MPVQIDLLPRRLPPSPYPSVARPALGPLPKADSASLSTIPDDVRLVLVGHLASIRDLVSLTQTHCAMRKLLVFHEHGRAISVPIVDESLSDEQAGASAAVVFPHAAILLAKIGTSLNRWVYTSSQINTKNERLQAVYNAAAHGENQLLGFAARGQRMRIGDVEDMRLTKENLYKPLATTLRTRVRNFNRISEPAKRVELVQIKDYVRALAAFCYYNAIIHHNGRHLVQAPRGLQQYTLFVHGIRTMMVQSCVLDSSTSSTSTAASIAAQQQLNLFLLPPCERDTFTLDDPLWIQHALNTGYATKPKSAREGARERFQGAQKIFLRCMGITTLKHVQEAWDPEAFFADADTAWLLTTAANSSAHSKLMMTNRVRWGASDLHLVPWSFMKDLVEKPKWLNGEIEGSLTIANERIKLLAATKRHERFEKEKWATRMREKEEQRRRHRERLEEERLERLQRRAEAAVAAEEVEPMAEVDAGSWVIRVFVHMHEETASTVDEEGDTLMSDE